MIFPYKTITLFILFVIFSVNFSPSKAEDVQVGKEKSAVCAACHGPEGISPIPIYPNLAGQKEQYLMSAITAYKNGSRTNAMMAPIVASLSEEDIQNLAAFYASLSCE